MSAWISHVKKYQNEHGCSYKDALKRASASYRKKQKGKGEWDNPAIGILENAATVVEKTGIPIAPQVLKAAASFGKLFKRDKISMPELQAMAKAHKRGDMKEVRRIQNLVKSRG